MSETQTAGQDKGTLNGQAQAPAGDPAAPPGECASGGEKTLAILAACFGAFLILMAIDMFTGGGLTGFVRESTG